MKTFTLLLLSASLLLVSSTKLPYKKFLKKTAFVYVPSGAILKDHESVSIFSFLMLDHEVTNFEYREFIQSNYLSKGDTLGAIAALPDTSLWVSDSVASHCGPYEKHYFNHPLFNNYPVVNVSKSNAESYCIWLTALMREKYPENSFNDFRLPTKSEWIYAAKGGLKDSPYPWGGPYVRNSKGQYLAQFNVVEDQNIKVDTTGYPKVVDDLKFNDRFFQSRNFATTSVKSFYPNNYGLYNMAGNVAELVADEEKAMGGHWQSYGNDIQVTSEVEFSNANPMVGFRPIMTYTVK